MLCLPNRMLEKIFTFLWEFSFSFFNIFVNFHSFFVGIFCSDYLCHDNCSSDIHLVRVDSDVQLFGIKQYVIVIRRGTRKMNILLRLLRRLRYGQCIVFVNDHKK